MSVSDTPFSAPSEEGTTASLRARQLVANHERVAMAVELLGASELADAEQAVLDYIAKLEAEVRAARQGADAGGSEAVTDADVAMLHVWSGWLIARGEENGAQFFNRLARKLNPSVQLGDVVSSSASRPDERSEERLDAQPKNWTLKVRGCRGHFHACYFADDGEEGDDIALPGDPFATREDCQAAIDADAARSQTGDTTR